MTKKRPAKGKRTKRGTRKPHTLSQAMRADDERLRDELKNADLSKFDAVLGKAIRPTARVTH